MKIIYSLILFTISFSLSAQNLDLQLYTSGLNKPVNIQSAGDDRLFVLELDGLIRIINSDGMLASQPFLDINDRVRNISGISEQGLLGLAFHPDYATNGFFYVNYINNSGNTVISRFTRVDSNSANPDSELILLTFNQPFSNHNGGYLAFGADGFLYISSGDGGSGGDPQDNGQDLSNLLGKILRIDVDQTANGLNYAIPGDNPFVSNSAARDEIWAYGLRNPWRFSFDRLTNDMWIGDVGQQNREEINLIGPTESGVNFGWRCYEGSASFNLTGCPPANTMEFPIAEYVHSGTSRCSVTGGFRYRGVEFMTLTGIYFFADYCSGEIGTLEFNGSNWDMEFYTLSSGQNWSTFGENNLGELFVASVSTGNIYKIVDNDILDVQDFAHGSLKMYPNPVNNIINLNFQNPNSEKLQAKIIDISGRIVKLASLSLQNNNAKINVEHLSKGLYFLQINSEQQSDTILKFIKD